MTIFKTAYEAWLKGSDFRTRRRRLKNYTYGRQWNDLVVDATTGKAVTEYDAAMNETGRRPLTNNLIRRLVKTVIGRYRGETENRQPPADKNIEKIYLLNRLNELDCRLLEEFLISGCAVQKISLECRRRGTIETFVDNVCPDDFFINSIRDPRGWDTRLIGMLHDMSVAEVVMKFAGSDRNRAMELHKIYDYENNRELLFPRGVSLGAEASAGNFFLSPTGRCRVIEVWTLESCEMLRCHDRATGIYYELPFEKAATVDSENKQREESGTPLVESRWEIVTKWHCRYFAPDGTLLSHSLSTLPDGDHPFIVKLYPLTDGEIHSFVEDIVGQQRHINRLITLIDHIMSTSAKGVLLFPVKSKPDSVTWDDISRRWASCGGVIPYNHVVGSPQPSQVTSSGLDAGASKLLEIQMQMINDVSGVGDMLLGRDISTNMSIERYESQLKNAASALTDILATFNDFVRLRDAKALSMQ